MLVPLYGFVAGDTLGVLVLVQDHETVADLAERLQQAAAVRVAPRSRVSVFSRGMRLDLRATVTQAGLAALDRVDLVGEDA
jgi:hypothetical protein